MYSDLYAGPTRRYTYAKVADTVKPLYSGHPWDVAKWLLYKLKVA